MAESHAVAGARDRNGRESVSAATLRAGRWLGLAAAPTFAAMAILAVHPGASPAETLCPAVRGAALSGGMATMYVLMAVFHLTPWLRLIASGARGAGS
jgi:hypothetical protein